LSVKNYKEIRIAKAFICIYCKNNIEYFNTYLNFKFSYVGKSFPLNLEILIEKSLLFVEKLRFVSGTFYFEPPCTLKHFGLLVIFLFGALYPEIM